jgi:DNA-binding LacI/PurR family transcriptional regulator
MVMNKLSVEATIATEIKRRILKQEYPIGSTLPNQRALAREFKTSPTTISRALTQVKENGLIELVPGRGTRVLTLAERPLSGAVAIVYDRDTQPVRHEPVMILNGMFTALNEKFQHYRALSTNAFDLDNLQADLADFSGIIFLEAGGEKVKRMIDYLESIRFPYVVANLEKNFNYNCTWVDHKKTTATAVKVLTALGHHRISFVTRDLNSFFYQNAFDGYKLGLQEANIPFDKDLILMIKNADHAQLFIERTKNFLNSLEHLPTAIVAGRDYQAQGIWLACEELGLKVGEDISIIGFDDISWPESNKLTTFKEPVTELGREAAYMIMEQINYGFKSTEKREIEAPLILRSSAGPCREAKVEPIPLTLYKSA